MKSMLIVLIVLGALLLVLVGLAFWRGEETLGLGARHTGSQLLRMAPVIVLALAIAGFAEALLPKAFVEHWLSEQSGWRGIVLAWVAGALTPAGSIIGLPLVAGLHRLGVGVGVLVTYMTSFALLSFVRIPLEVGFIGWRLTSLRIIASLALPPLAGLLARLLVR